VRDNENCNAYKADNMELEIFNFHSWTPLAAFGFVHTFWTLYIDTILCSWLAMIALFFICKAITYVLKHYPQSLPSFIIKSITRGFIGVAEETLGTFDASCFSFAMGMFLFAFSCTLVSLIPGVEEATHDVNTTFALSFVSFLFVQFQGFKAHGFSHLKEYTEPFIFMLPMHIVGDLAKITSMSFRLFGNILAGSVILQLMFFAMAKLSTAICYYSLAVGVLFAAIHIFTKISPKYSYLQRVPSWFYGVFFFPAGIQLFFGLFEGLIQSFIVALLTLTYTGLSINSHKSDS
jgi:F-type H+-transporting ATPase subunit a